MDRFDKVREVICGGRANNASGIGTMMVSMSWKILGSMSRKWCEEESTKAPAEHVPCHVTKRPILGGLETTIATLEAVHHSIWPRT